jgi:2-amino-4-hydroxy-6-hydroxymethyldihydropteridine diphosphokinase
MATVYLSLGSNQQRERNLCSCLQRLRQNFTAVTCSTVYETAAVGFSGEAFLNLVVRCTTSYTPNALQAYLRTLEDAHGRVRNGEKYSPRTLDVDLLLYDDLNHQPEQNLPHNDILRYSFVLFPLLELDSELVHPALHCSLQNLIAKTGLSTEGLQAFTLDCRHQVENFVRN